MLPHVARAIPKTNEILVFRDVLFIPSSRVNVSSYRGILWVYYFSLSTRAIFLMDSRWKQHNYFFGLYLTSASHNLVRFPNCTSRSVFCCPHIFDCSHLVHPISLRFVHSFLMFDEQTKDKYWTWAWQPKLWNIKWKSCKSLGQLGL